MTKISKQRQKLNRQGQNVHKTRKLSIQREKLSKRT